MARVIWFRRGCVVSLFVSKIRRVPEVQQAKASFADDLQSSGGAIEEVIVLAAPPGK